MSVTLTASSNHTETPVDLEFLGTTLAKNSVHLEEVGKFTHEVSEALHSKSSKHKFIISVTKIISPTPVKADLKFRNSVCAIWDQNKDGFYSFEVKPPETKSYMVTIFWISRF
ncbi:hypothetical protein CJJ07_004409 [Candidozyma auris]|nr:hypothetical protein CJJ07_004409 [[Candida] auris]